MKLVVSARVESARSRMVQTMGEVVSPAGEVLASALAKYVPLSVEQHREFVATALDEPATAQAARLLQIG